MGTEIKQKIYRCIRETELKAKRLKILYTVKSQFARTYWNVIFQQSLILTNSYSFSDLVLLLQNVVRNAPKYPIFMFVL